MNSWLKKHFTSNQLFLIYVLLVLLGTLISIASASVIENPLGYIIGIFIMGIGFIVLDAA